MTIAKVAQKDKKQSMWGLQKRRDWDHKRRQDVLCGRDKIMQDLILTTYGYAVWQQCILKCLVIPIFIAFMQSLYQYSLSKLYYNYMYIYAYVYMYMSIHAETVMEMHQNPASSEPAPYAASGLPGQLQVWNKLSWYMVHVYMHTATHACTIVCRLYMYSWSCIHVHVCTCTVSTYRVHI